MRSVLEALRQLRLPITNPGIDLHLGQAFDVPQVGTGQLSAIKAAQVSLSQAGADQHRLRQQCELDVRFSKAGTLEGSAGKVGTAQPCLCEVRARHRRAMQIGADQIGLRKVGSREVSSCEPGVVEPGTPQLHAGKAHPAEIGRREIGAGTFLSARLQIAAMVSQDPLDFDTRYGAHNYVRSPLRGCGERRAGKWPPGERA
jgi:hypothetical protein